MITWEIADFIKCDDGLLQLAQVNAPNGARLQLPFHHDILPHVNVLAEHDLGIHRERLVDVNGALAKPAQVYVVQSAIDDKLTVKGN